MELTENKPGISHVPDIFPHVQFTCYLKEEKLTATVNSFLLDPVSYVFEIKFSGSYVSRFLSLQKGWYDQKAKRFSKYSQAIEHNLSALLILNPSHEYYILNEELPDADNINIWIVRNPFCDEGKNSKKYIVKYLGCQFGLEKKNYQWQVSISEKVNHAKPNRQLIQRIIKSMEDLFLEQQIN